MVTPSAQGSRNERASIPAATITTCDTPSACALSSASSKSLVRTTIGADGCPVSELDSASNRRPSSPANRSANGSRKSASSRADSSARIAATRRPVAATACLVLSIGPSWGSRGQRSWIFVPHFRDGDVTGQQNPLFGILRRRHAGERPEFPDEVGLVEIADIGRDSSAGPSLAEQPQRRLETPNSGIRLGRQANLGTEQRDQSLGG